MYFSAIIQFCQTLNFPVNTITASAGTVRFDTGGLPAAAITMDGNVQINLAGTPPPTPDSGGGQSSSLASSSGSNTPADNNADSIPKLGFTPPNANANPDGTIAPTDKTPPLGFSGNVAGDLLAMAGGSGPSLFGGAGGSGDSGGASGGIGGMGAGLGGSGGFMSLADVGLSDSDVDSGSRLGSSNTPFVLQYDCTGRPTMRDDGPLIGALQGAFDSASGLPSSDSAPAPTKTGASKSASKPGTDMPSKKFMDNVTKAWNMLPASVKQFQAKNGYKIQVYKEGTTSPAFTDPKTKTISLYENFYEGDKSINTLENYDLYRTFMHEIGHAVDAVYKITSDDGFKAAYKADLNTLDRLQRGKFPGPYSPQTIDNMKDAIPVLNEFSSGHGDQKTGNAFNDTSVQTFGDSILPRGMMEVEADVFSRLGGGNDREAIAVGNAFLQSKSYVLRATGGAFVGPLTAPSKF